MSVLAQTPGWLQPQLREQQGMGQAGTELSAVLEFVRPLMEGRIFPPLKPLWCRDVLPVRFASACLVLLWQMRRMNPQSVMGQEGQPCWGSASSGAASVPPQLCLLPWPSCGHGTLRAPHQQPQQSSHTKFWLLLGTTGLEGCQESGGKILLTCCSETWTHKWSF